MRTLTILIIGAFVLDVFFLAANGVSATVLSRHDPAVFTRGQPKDELSLALVRVYFISSFFYLLSYFFGAVLFFFWLVRANKNARALGSRGMEFTPRWVVGAFFVPFLNLVRPYEAVEELYQASDPESDEESWASVTPPRFILLWWLSWLGFGVVGTLSRLFPRMLFLLPVSVGAIAAALAAGVLFAIDRRQVAKRERFDLAPKAPPSSGGMSHRFL